MTSITVHGKRFRPHIPTAAIQSTVQKVAEQIKRDYADDPDGVCLVGVLTGAFMFTSDLSRYLGGTCTMTKFIEATSYSGMKSTKTLTFKLGFLDVIRGKNVIIVEDVVDTGFTMNGICEKIKEFEPKSVNICTMFLKPSVFNKHRHLYSHYPKDGVKYVGQEIGHEFIVGYGLDYDEHARSYPDVYILDEIQEVKV